MAIAKALDRSVREKTEHRSLISKRSLEIRDLNETVTREVFVAALYIVLGKPELRGSCRLYKCFGGLHQGSCRGCPYF